jgi:DNA-binding NarL/FixJ family response regulator
MANVVMVGLDETAADRIGEALGAGLHRIDRQPSSAEPESLDSADIVFAGSDRQQYLPLLRGFRTTHPSTPFVVVARIPDTGEWIDAMEAGATDYCSETDEARQIGWIVNSLLPLAKAVAAA